MKFVKANVDSNVVRMSRTSSSSEEGASERAELSDEFFSIDDDDDNDDGEEPNRSEEVVKDRQAEAVDYAAAVAAAPIDEDQALDAAVADIVETKRREKNASSIIRTRYKYQVTMPAATIHV